MKFLLSLFFACSNLPSFEQLNLTEDDKAKIAFTVVSYKAKIHDKSDLPFSLSIKNISSDSIKIPGKYSFAPYTAQFAGTIAYEVIYCSDKDTLDYTKVIDADFDGPTYYENTHNLKSGDSYIIQSSFEPLYFWKKGVYKVRFLMKKGSFREIISENTYTDWIFVTVNGDLLPSKNGSHPIMRQ